MLSGKMKLGEKFPHLGKSLDLKDGQEPRVGLEPGCKDVGDNLRLSSRQY
jgi:hypothetical protein